MPSVKPVPDGYRTVTPYLTINGADRAIEFYKKAFGAQEIVRMASPDGKIAHAEIKIGDSMIMLGDESPQSSVKSPKSVGATTASIFLYIDDVDRVYDRAIAAGGTATMRPADMFWGDRYGKLVDPFGHEWSLATHTEDVSPEEMQKRAAAAFASAH